MSSRTAFASSIPHSWPQLVQAKVTIPSQYVLGSPQVIHGPGSGSAAATAAAASAASAASAAAAAAFVVSSLTFITIDLDSDRWADNRWVVATCVVRKAVADTGQSSKHAKDMVLRALGDSRGEGRKEGTGARKSVFTLVSNFTYFLTY